MIIIVADLKRNIVADLKRMSFWETTKDKRKS